MFPCGKYFLYDNGNLFSGTLEKKKSVWTTSETYGKVYSYEEAIEITGNGRYNLGLMVAMSLAFLAMGIDMFSFSTVVALSRCDLQLDLRQTTILMSIPFIGPISMAYAWGYISDTQGRRRSLLLGMSCGFFMSVLCAFAPHWIILGVFKLIGTCFCSCAQSTTYALLGESCPARVRGPYMIFMSSVIMFAMSAYFTPAYLIGYLDFSFNLGLVTFVPWRLYALVLALPLATSAVSLLFFYESPKFLLNTGKQEEALEILKKISLRNGIKDYEHNVKNLHHLRTNQRRMDMSFLQSLWAQTMPLFKPPLLWKTLILYYYTFAIFSITSTIFVWMPFLAELFTKGMSDSTNESQGLCSIIKGHNHTTTDRTSCTSSVDLPIVIVSFVLGVILCVINIVLTRLSSWKKTFSILTFLLSALFSVGCLIIKNDIANVVMFFGIMLLALNMGVVGSYFVDLFPTSYLGMASCLSVVVARISSIIGINFMGPLLLTNCSALFIFWACYMISAASVCWFLPSDTSNSTTQHNGTRVTIK